jgi:hypothetical protein
MTRKGNPHAGKTVVVVFVLFDFSLLTQRIMTHLTYLDLVDQSEPM